MSGEGLQAETPLFSEGAQTVHIWKTFLWPEHTPWLSPLAFLENTSLGCWYPSPWGWEKRWAPSQVSMQSCLFITELLYPSGHGPYVHNHFGSSSTMTECHFFYQDCRGAVVSLHGVNDRIQRSNPFLYDLSKNLPFLTPPAPLSLEVPEAPSSWTFLGFCRKDGLARGFPTARS